MDKDKDKDLFYIAKEGAAAKFFVEELSVTSFQELAVTPLWNYIQKSTCTVFERV